MRGFSIWGFPSLEQGAHAKRVLFIDFQRFVGHFYVKKVTLGRFQSERKF
jgi:hypothetical protein